MNNDYFKYLPDCKELERASESIRATIKAANAGAQGMKAASEAAKLQMQILNSLPDFSHQLELASASVQATIRAVELGSAGIKAVLSAAKQQAEVLEKVIGNIDLSGFFEAMKSAEDEFEINKKTGWWEIDHVLDDLPASEVKKAIRGEEKDGAFSKMIVDRIKEDDWKILRELGRQWQDRPFVKESQKKILQDVVDAHIEARYTLSIPAILPIIERFYKDFLLKKNDEIWQLPPEQLGNVSVAEFYEIYPLRFFFDELLFADGYRVSKKKGRKALNRNLILHGVNPDYANELISAKLILFLDKIFRLI